VKRPAWVSLYRIAIIPNRALVAPMVGASNRIYLKSRKKLFPVMDHASESVKSLSQVIRTANRKRVIIQ